MIEIEETWNAWRYSKLKSEILDWSELGSYEEKWAWWMMRSLYYVRSMARWEKCFILLVVSWERTPAKTCPNLFLQKSNERFLKNWKWMEWIRERKFLKNKSYVSIGCRLSFASNRSVLSRVQRIPSSYFSGGDLRSMKWVISIFEGFYMKNSWRERQGKFYVEQVEGSRSDS